MVCTKAVHRDDLKLHQYLLNAIFALQPALYFGIARLLKQQEGDDEGGLIEEAEFQKALSRARRNNIDVLGDIVTRQMLPPMTDTGWSYGVPEGSL